MKEYVEALERLYGLSPTQMTAVRAAIELMRAVAPKDEAAERALCRRAAEDISGWPDLEADIEEVFELRAQARADGVASVRAKFDQVFEANGTLVAQLSAAQKELRIANANIGELYAREKQHLTALAVAHSELDTARKFADYLEVKLSAAQALNDQCARDFADKLSAAQAEIERLKARYAQAGQDYAHEAETRDELETQLAGAQADAESHRQALLDMLRNLSSAQAEIADHEKAEEHKHELFMEACDQRDALETKLQNLRTAAERFINSEIGFESMNAAIEASRS